MDSPKNPLDIVFDNLKQEMESAGNIRRAVINNIESQVRNLNVIGEGDSASMIEAKTGLISALDGLLKSQETAALNHTKVTLSRKESEVDSKVGAYVTEMLRMVTLAEIQPSRADDRDENVDARIEQAFEASGLDILDSELATVEGADDDEEEDEEDE